MLTLTLGALTLVSFACSEQSSRSPIAPAVSGGAANIVRTAETRRLEVCKDFVGTPTSTVNFNVSIDIGADGIGIANSVVAIAPGGCAEIHTNTGTGPGGDRVTVTEQVPTGFTPTYTVATAVIDVPGSTTTGPFAGNSFSTIVHNDLGYLVIFTNTAPPVNPELGRFTGGGNQIKVDGVRVSRGLTIHCDKLLSNNLELNWGSGDNFHMEEHLTTIACTDDPAIIQAPPPAPLDTLKGTGVGSFNGVDGYRIEFTLVDYGEPGENDKMAVRITSPTGTVVLNIPLQVLENGNLQAHYDQPHR
jgi:hypothetical protein